MESSIFKNLYLFKELEPAELAQVSEIAQEKTYSAGQDIFISGQAASSLYLIRMGTVKIYSTSKTGDDIAISNLSSGSHFGEMPLLDGEKRSATAQATETATLIEIPYEPLKKLLTANPNMAAKIYFAMAHFLCGRLRNTNEDLSKAKELRLRHF